MALRKFGDKDIFVNTMRTFPSCDFIVYDSKVIYNATPAQSGARNDPLLNVSSSKGFISLYEYNIDRPYLDTGRFVQTANISDTGQIYPWISKDSARSSFKTANSFKSSDATTYNNEFQYGDILTNVYPLSASITRIPLVNVANGNSIVMHPDTIEYNGERLSYSLKNQMESYSLLSSKFDWESIFNNGSDWANVIAIPSIFYGSRIYPGSLDLKLYFTGTLVGQLQDTRQNGELIQVNSLIAPTGTVEGLVLYKEGIIILTGSSDLTNNFTYLNGESAPGQKLPWLYFGVGANDGISDAMTYVHNINQVSSRLTFKGQSDTQVMTMFAHAKRGEVNYSNNPTFLEYGQERTFFTSSHVYEENSDIKLKNFVSSSHTDYSASFERQVFVSRVAIYDKNKNLIGIATLANPVLKKEGEDVSFKLKIDI